MHKSCWLRRDRDSKARCWGKAAFGLGSSTSPHSTLNILATRVMACPYTAMNPCCILLFHMDDSIARDTGQKPFVVPSYGIDTVQSRRTEQESERQNPLTQPAGKNG